MSPDLVNVLSALGDYGGVGILAALVWWELRGFRSDLRAELAAVRTSSAELTASLVDILRPRIQA